MSLEHLRATRLDRKKPAMVNVIVGDLPEWFDRRSEAIVVRPGDDPGRMDWRPMVGVLCAVYGVAKDPTQFLAVMDALRAAGANFFGAANHAGVFPLLVDADAEHERLLRRGWEIACRF